MSVFVDPTDTFELFVKYRVNRDERGKVVSTTILPDDYEGSDAVTLMCDCAGRDFNTMSFVLEEATVINHTNGSPMLRRGVLYRQVIVNFIKAWNLRDNTTGNAVQITPQVVGAMRDELVRALAKKWLLKTKSR